MELNDILGGALKDIAGTAVKEFQGTKSFKKFVLEIFLVKSRKSLFSGMPFKKSVRVDPLTKSGRL